MLGLYEECAGLDISCTSSDHIMELALDIRRGIDDNDVNMNLQLAAELGKTLLERNKELESQLRNANHAYREQAGEIDLLTKQLEVLRTVNESRMRIYEEVDKSQQELDAKNEQLQAEAKDDKATIKTLQSKANRLQTSCDELNAKVEMLREECRSRSRTSDRRTWSVPSLVEATDREERQSKKRDPNSGTSEHMLILLEARKDAEIKDLKLKMFNMREQVNREIRNRTELETELSGVLQENTDLHEQSHHIEDKQARITSLEDQLEEMELRAGTICKYCREKLADGVNLPEVINIEPDDMEIQHGQLHRLKCGGSAYGSRESLNNMGLEIEDDFCYIPPTREIMNAVDNLVTPSREVATFPGEEEDDMGKSILGELEEQYLRLVNKYESLVESKNQRQAESRDMGVQKNLESRDQNRPTSISLQASTETQTKTPTPSQNPSQNPQVVMRKKTPGSRSKTPKTPKRHLNIGSPSDPTEDHFGNAPPEYKVLFQEIFQTLRRSVVVDDDQNPIDVLGEPKANPKTF